MCLWPMGGRVNLVLGIWRKVPVGGFQACPFIAAICIRKDVVNTMSLFCIFALASRLAAWWVRGLTASFNTMRTAFGDGPNPEPPCYAM